MKTDCTAVWHQTLLMHAGTLNQGSAFPGLTTLLTREGRVLAYRYWGVHFCQLGWLCHCDKRGKEKAKQRVGQHTRNCLSFKPMLENKTAAVCSRAGGGVSGSRQCRGLCADSTCMKLCQNAFSCSHDVYIISVASKAPHRLFLRSLFFFSVDNQGTVNRWKWRGHVVNCEE